MFVWETRLLTFPQLFCREARAFGHRFELGPDDLRIADARTEAAVGAGHNIFAADDLGVADQTVGDRLRVFDDVRRMSDDSGHEDFACGKLHFFPDTPLVFMARV